MFDLRTQSHLVDATATVMYSCLTATTNTWAASAYHGLSLWAEILGAASRRGTAAWAASTGLHGAGPRLGAAMERPD